MDLIFGIELISPRSQPGEPPIRLGESDIYEVLETKLGLKPEEDVSVIQMLSPHPRRVDVTLKCLAVWSDRELHQFMDLHYELANGKRVFISKPYDDLLTGKVKKWREFFLTMDL